MLFFAGIMRAVGLAAVLNVLSVHFFKGMLAQGGLLSSSSNVF